MTSEVCVMNRRALVLAADSAVTVSKWDEDGKREERYFKGANKVFQLSNHHPVGMMIFDTADLHRVPWEILAKEYRNQLDDSRCGQLEDYANSFFEYVQQNLNLFTAEDRASIFIEAVDRAMVRNLAIATGDARVAAAVADSAAKDAAIIQSLTEIRDLLRSVAISAPITQAEIDALVVLHQAKLAEEAATDIQMFAPGCAISIPDLIEIGVSAVFRFEESYLSTTGIVVAGFGDSDYFPEYKEYNCFGLFGSKLLVRSVDEHKITRKSTGHISAFAMKTMVDTFYLGFSPDVFSAVKDKLREKLVEQAPTIIASVGGSATEIPNAIIEQIVSEHTNAWTYSIFDKHAEPFRSVIGSLPIDELASLAETLVMLESLKEKVTKPSESVGGPIDVAVITKSEGFIWIKRKLYFEPALNPRYFNRKTIS